MDVKAGRKIALSLPGATEEDHFAKPSFRVRGRIFATVPDPRHVNVFIDPVEVDGAVRLDPRAFAPVMWGKEVRGVQVNLPRASPDMVRDLLTAAWRRKASNRAQ